MERSLSHQNKQRRVMSYDKITSNIRKQSSLQKKQLINTLRMSSKQQKYSNANYLFQIKTARLLQPVITNQQYKQPQFNSKQTKKSTNSQQINPTSSSPSLHSHPKLTLIPKVQNSHLITCLNYPYNKIASIPKDFAKIYNNITQLNLSHNQITQIEVICNLDHLVQLDLGHNNVCSVPKQIKKLRKLQLLNLSFNKLWYVTQIVPLKDIIRIRTEQMNQDIHINLQGNSVIKTNQKAVQKLIYCNKKCIETKKTNLRTILNSLQVEKCKQNICPNKVDLIKQNQAAFKTSKNKSINQSLLDISAIITKVPLNSENKVELFQSVSQTLQLKKKASDGQNSHQNRNSPCMSVQEYLRSSKIPNTILNCSYNFNSIQIQQSKTKNNQDEAKLKIFFKLQNFEKDIIQPAKDYFSSLNQINKKLKLIQKIKQVKQIPQNLKEEFQQLNQDVMDRIDKIIQVIKPFLNFFDANDKDHLNSSFMQKIQEKINNVKGLKPKIKRFHQHMLQLFLNVQTVPQTKWYEIWANQYSIFLKIFSKVQTFLNIYMQLHKKVSQIQRFANIFDQDESRTQENRNQMPKVLRNSCFSLKKQTGKQQLKNLLFSQNKQQKSSLFSSQKKESLLLSQKNSKSSRNLNFQAEIPLKKARNCAYCMQCPIKDQQIIALNEKIELQQQKNKESEYKIQKLNKLCIELEQIRQFSQNLKDQQISIVQKIQTIKPSTYQNLLLQQAKTIQDLISDKNANVLCKYYGQKDSKNSKSIAQGRSIYQNSRMRYQKTSQNNCLGSKSRIFGAEKPKIQGHEFMLTQKSAESNHKKTLQKSQRTYFKSNGTLPFSSQNSKKRSANKQNENQSKNLSSKNNISNKNCFTVERYNSKCLNSNLHNKKQTGLNQPQQSSNDKNGIFQKIIVGQFLEQKFDNNKVVNNQNEEIGQGKQAKEINFKYQNTIQKQSNQLQQKQTDQFQEQNGIHPNNKNAIKKKLPDQNQNRERSGSLRLKTDPGFSTNDMEFMISNGYDYENLQVQQKIHYKNYIRFHLRNNIRQILQRKNKSKLQRSSNHKNQLWLQPQYKIRNMSLVSKTIPEKNRMSANGSLQSGGARSCSELRGLGRGKYIQKRQILVGNDKKRQSQNYFIPSQE